MIDTYYEQKLQKIEEAHLRKQKRLEKRIELLKGKPKRVPIKTLKKEAKRITHKIVRLTTPDFCYTCSKPIQKGDKQAGHCFPDGNYPGTRYDYKNIRQQGSCCNLYKHGNLAEFCTRLLSELGLDEFNALSDRAHRPFTWTRELLEQLIAERKPILEELEKSSVIS